jgi:branched-chain amino acid transport system permease protein
MIYPLVKRDRLPGPRGFIEAVAGPMVGVGVLTAVAAALYADSSLTEIILIFGINAIMVIGFQTFVGSTGIVSFGHVAFMAVGAYATAVVSLAPADKAYLLPRLPHSLAKIELGVIPALLIGGIAAAVLAAISGLALLRLTGAAASIATLGLLVITVNVLSEANRFTAGPRTLFGIPQDANFAWVFGTLAAVVLFSAIFKWSSLGLRSRANRDDVIASEAAGIGTLRARLVPFVLSAFMTGVGGGLYGMLITAFSPASFTIALGVVVITMAIIGGINSISGALAGAAAVTVVNEVFRRVENGFHFLGAHIQAPTGISSAVLGAALILMLRWRPAGLLSAYELQLARRPTCDQSARHGLERASEQPPDVTGPVETKVP